MSDFHNPSDFGYRTDNPGDDYCLRKQRIARQHRDQYGTDGLQGKMASGAVTAHMGIFKPMYIPSKMLRHLMGANEEHIYRRVGDVKYDRLAQLVRDNGWKQDHAVMVRVNHEGVACIMEGNTRTAVANALSIPDLKVQFEWMNGAEHAPDDLWSPARVAALCSPTASEHAPASTPDIDEIMGQLGFLKEDEEIDNDRYKPIRMKEPKVLYRSVSLAELKDIVRTNRIKGGQNRFNDFDGRRCVFFGDKINERLIWQGEETERQAHHALSTHVIHRQFKNLTERAKEEGLYVVTLFRQAKVPIRPNYEEGLIAGQNIGVSYFLNLAFQISDVAARHRVTDALRKIKDIFDDVAELQKRFRRLYDAEHSIVKKRAASLHYTSAILVTRPLTGGIHYSKHHQSGSFSGMGDDDEYGFPPNELTFHDIRSVMMVQRGKIVDEMSPDDVEQHIDEITSRPIE